MAISFNTGTTASASTASSVGVTIPAGVLANDVMIMMVTVFCETGTQPTISITGNAWTLVPMNTGTNPEVATAGSSIWSYGFAYYRVATAGDIGASITISETGSAAGTTWFAVALASYTGANTSSPIDVAAGNNAQAVASLNGPTINTVTANDWAIQMCGGAVASGDTLNGPATNREFVTSAASVDAGLSDSNGTVAAGTNIGGGNWNNGAVATANWYSAFTIGLAPPGAAVAFPPRSGRRTAARTPALPPVRRFRQMLPVPAQLNPPYPFIEISQRRQAHPRSLVRHSRVTIVVPPQLNPPYPFAEVRQWRQPHGFWPRRGRIMWPVPAQDAPVSQARRTRPDMPPRRGRQAQPVPAQVTVLNPAWVQGHRPPLRAIALIRRRWHDLFPWPQATRPVLSPATSVSTVVPAATAASVVTDPVTGLQTVTAAAMSVSAVTEQ